MTMDRSNNIENSKRQYILYTLFQHFLNDFSISDVRYELVPEIFTTDEYEEIRSYTNLAQQIERMFFYLIYAGKNVQNFTSALDTKYDWISNHLRALLKENPSNNNQSVKYLKRVQELRRESPKYLDLNVHRLDLLWEIVKHLKSLKRGHYLVLHGNLLYGKKWLALDACSNFSVMQHMDFNIFWFNVGTCDSQEKVLVKLQRLLIHLNCNELDVKLSNYEDIENKIVVLKQRLRELLEQDEYRKCLIILANVQDPLIIKAFDLRAKILITTRNKKVLDSLPDSETQKVEIMRGLTKVESLELFAKVLNVPEKSLPDEATDIHNLSKGNPFLISMIACNLKEYPNRDARWKSWKKSVAKYELTEEFREIIEHSVSELADDHKERFKSLVIFKDDFSIPISVLQMYWNYPSNIVEMIVQKFDKLHLLEIKHQTSMTCSLQYHYYSYLKSLTTPDERREMHQKLVDCYNIPDAIQHRTEPNIIKLPHDGYFHFYIAYHLSEANMCELFPKLFLDFGFLEQKLRATGLPNTLGDLKLHQTAIIAKSDSNLKFFKQLLHFLPNVEELIMKSDDTCILQYAITTFGILKERALAQAALFTNRIWFTDNDHTHKHRQIVPLPDKADFVRFIEPDIALAAMNHSILLTDLSTTYTVEPTIYTGHKSKIKDIQHFLENYFISCDVDGMCKIWTMSNTPVERRKRVNRSPPYNNGHNAARRTRSSTYDTVNISREKSIQTLEIAKNPIQCIYLSDDSDSDHIQLLAATMDGQVLLYEWDFKESKFHYKMAFVTKIRKIQSLMMANVSSLLLILDCVGKIYFYNMTSSNEVPYSSFWTAPNFPIALHNYSPNVALGIFKRQIVKIYFSLIKGNFVNTEFRDIYAIEQNANSIVCSVLSQDSQYLILGTKKGIIVLDPVDGTEILTNNVSESIKCIDCCSLDDSVYKYVLLSATEQIGPAVALTGLEINQNQEIQWASNRMGSPINESLLCRHDQLNTRFLGGNLFAVDYSSDDDLITITAVDSKGRIHKEFYGETPDDDLAAIDDPIQLDLSTVRSFSSNSIHTYIGYDNGCVYNLHSEEPLFILPDPICFLKCFQGNDVLIVGTKNDCVIRSADKEFKTESTSIANAYQIGSFIILIKLNGSIDTFDLKNGKFNVINIANDHLGGCDLKADTLICATKDNQQIKIWKLTVTETCDIHLKAEIHLTEKLRITCVGISQLTEFFALGCHSGEILLYDGQTMQYIRLLNAHKSPITDLLFAPWTSQSSSPVVLISTAEQICFWNVCFALNNPLDRRRLSKTNLRSSQRFTTRNSFRSERPIAAGDQNEADEMPDDVFYSPNSWSGKFGADHKPELLSCIKFVGNSATKIFANRQFNHFITIDDEGEIYNLKNWQKIALSTNGHK